MTRPHKHQEDWKVVETFSDGGQRMALLQKYRLYAMSRPDHSSMESHPVEEYKVVPVSKLSDD